MNHQTEGADGRRSDKGFTLVELLIVIVILGILATVTVFAVRGITDKGTKSACEADKSTLATAAESYFAQYGGTYIPFTAHGADGSATAIVPVTTPAQTWVLGSTADQTLVNAGFLRSVSTKYTLALTTTAPIGWVTGKTLTPVSGSGCA